METNQNRFEQLDEAWIAKYRAALNNTAVQQSRFTMICASLTDARKTVVSQIKQIKRIVSGWPKTKAQKLLAPKEPVMVPESRTVRCAVKRVELSDKNGFKEAAAKPKRARPLRPTQKYRAG
jgi:hypothetical protein